MAPTSLNAQDLGSISSSPPVGEARIPYEHPDLHVTLQPLEIHGVFAGRCSANSLISRNGAILGERVPHRACAVQTIIAGERRASFGQGRQGSMQAGLLSVLRKPPPPASRGSLGGFEGAWHRLTSRARRGLVALGSDFAERFGEWLGEVAGCCFKWCIKWGQASHFLPLHLKMKTGDKRFACRRFFRSMFLIVQITPRDGCPEKLANKGGAGKPL